MSAKALVCIALMLVVASRAGSSRPPPAASSTPCLGCARWCGGKRWGEGGCGIQCEGGRMLAYMITHHRWVFCIFLLMPLSVAFDVFLYVRNTVQFWLRKRAPRQHAVKVQDVQRQLLEWAKEGGKQKLCTGRPGWQTMSLRVGKYKKTFRNIRLDLYDILEIETSGPEPYVRVEPLVTMGQLTAALNPLGWTMPVLPELDDLTVGGLIAGVGVESSSHKYGLFQHISRRLEVALADGSVVFCSPEDNAELFYNLPWSHGTLGFLLSAEIRIVPCKPYVRLRYIPFHDGKAAIETFETESRKSAKEGVADFVEALAFGENRFVVMIGNMVENPTELEAGTSINPIGHFYKPWFFKHVEGYLMRDTHDEVVEYIPLRHYYHRHSKSLFWEIQDIIPFGNHPGFRYLFGWMMPPRISLLKLTQTEALRKLYEERHVVQDMLVPIKHLAEAMEVFDEVFCVYPLWLCPMRIPRNPQYDQWGGFVRPLKDGDEMFVDIGAYGNPQIAGFNARAACRKVEDYVRERSGYQMMYADSYMSRAEFRQMFDHRVYDQLRAKLHLCLNAFPEVYDKVRS